MLVRETVLKQGAPCSLLLCSGLPCAKDKPMVVSFFKGNAEKQRRLDFALFFFAFCIFFQAKLPEERKPADA